jgi:uncharacterized protein (DUF58 family)
MLEKLKKLFKLSSEAEKTASRLPDLLAEVDRVASTMMQGFHGRRKKGAGETFWQYSEFFDQEHERRKIDWRRSAKEDRLYVRENEWEASESVFLWRDSSPGMDWKYSDKTQYTKKEAAEILMLSLGKLLTNVDERVAMIGTEGGLSRKIDSLINELAVEPETNELAWEELGQKGKPLPKDGYVVLFSDFLGRNQEEVESAVIRLANLGVKGHLVHVNDRAELDFPYEGNILFENMNSGNEALIPKTESIKEEYNQKVKDHKKAIQKLAESVNWGYSSYVTDEPLHYALIPFYNGGQDVSNSKPAPKQP